MAAAADSRSHLSSVDGEGSLTTCSEGGRVFSNSYSDCLAEDADVLRSQAGNEFQHSSANRLYLDSFFPNLGPSLRFCVNSGWLFFLE